VGLQSRLAAALVVFEVCQGLEAAALLAEPVAGVFVAQHKGEVVAGQGVGEVLVRCHTAANVLAE
jgi:hypothetical protein